MDPGVDDDVLEPAEQHVERARQTALPRRRSRVGRRPTWEAGAFRPILDCGRGKESATGADQAPGVGAVGGRFGSITDSALPLGSMNQAAHANPMSAIPSASVTGSGSV